MTEPSVITSPWFGPASNAPVVAHEPASPSADRPAEEIVIDMHDGPDYVDDWMEENLPTSLVDFVRKHCTSFIRWDLLRQLRSDPAGATLESLIRRIGTTERAVAAELRGLEAAGLVSRKAATDSAVYRLRPTSDLVQALEAAISAYDENREFRFALVYSIVRATHSRAVVE